MYFHYNHTIGTSPPAVSEMAPAALGLECSARISAIGTPRVHCRLALKSSTHALVAKSLIAVENIGSSLLSACVENLERSRPMSSSLHWPSFRRPSSSLHRWSPSALTCSSKITTLSNKVNRFCACEWTSSEDLSLENKGMAFTGGNCAKSLHTIHVVLFLSKP